MKTLVVQPGHYGRTTEATGTPGEKGWAFRVAQTLQLQMRQHPEWSAFIIKADTRDSRYEGDAFVSIHADGAANPAASGSSFGYQNESGRAFGMDWRHAYLSLRPHQKLREPNYTENLAKYYGVYKAIHQGNTRAAIFEFGFMTNPKEREWLESHVEECAATIYRAVTGDWPPRTPGIARLDPSGIKPMPVRDTYFAPGFDPDGNLSEVSIMPMPPRKLELRLEEATDQLPRVVATPSDRDALRRAAELLSHQQGTVVESIKPRLVPRAVVEWILKNLLDLLYRS